MAYSEGVGHSHLSIHMSTASEMTLAQPDSQNVRWAQKKIGAKNEGRAENHPEVRHLPEVEREAAALEISVLTTLSREVE